MSTGEAWESKMHAEHDAKYRALAERLGFATLAVLVPATPERIRQALAAGDVHLNTINLAAWDRAAGVRAPWGAIEPCPTCGARRTVPGGPDWPYGELRRTAQSAPWNAAPSLSLAERVCVLKWVAVQMAEGREA